jgi:hypothetical protein
VGNLLTNTVSVNFSRRALLYEVIQVISIAKDKN